MALLLVILALFGFVFAGIGSGSSGTSGSTTHRFAPQAASDRSVSHGTCRVLTWKKASAPSAGPAHRRRAASCRFAGRGDRLGGEHPRAFLERGPAEVRSAT